MGKQNLQTKKAWWQPAIELFAQVSSWIVFPLLCGIFGGKWLQEKWGHEPWIYIGCVAIAFIITNIALLKITIKAAKKMQDIIGDTEKKEDKK